MRSRTGSGRRAHHRTMRDFDQTRTARPEQRTSRRGDGKANAAERILVMQRSAGNAAVARALGTVQRASLANSTPSLAEDAPVTAGASTTQEPPEPERPVQQEEIELREYRDQVTDERVKQLMTDALVLMRRVTFIQTTGNASGAHTNKNNDKAPPATTYEVRYNESPAERAAAASPDEQTARTALANRAARLYHELTHALLNEELNDSDMLNHHTPQLDLNGADAGLKGEGKEQLRQTERLKRAGQALPGYEDQPTDGPGMIERFGDRRAAYVEQRTAQLRTLVAASKLTPEHQAGVLSRLEIMERNASTEYDPILTHFLVWAQEDKEGPGDAFYDRVAGLLDEAKAARGNKDEPPIGTAAEGAAYRVRQDQIAQQSRDAYAARQQQRLAARAAQQDQGGGALAAVAGLFRGILDAVRRLLAKLGIARPPAA
jgi:hypothetical protein